MTGISLFKKATNLAPEPLLVAISQQQASKGHQFLNRPQRNPK
jgi:hypothetical protein